MAQNIILTNKQQKRALSAKKRSKENIRNILANPYSRYWPLIKESDFIALKNVLSEHLPKLKAKKIAVPINVIKQVPKEDRKSARISYRKSTDIIVDEGTKNCIVVGVNGVTKNLENKNICATLIDADVSPQFMVQHIIDLAVESKIPVLTVPKLKEILEEQSGIPSLVIGLKCNLQIDSSLWIIYETIKNISSNYPIPDNNSNNLLIDLDSVDRDSDVKDEDFTLNSFTYLYRHSNENRTFVPPKDKFIKMDVDSNNFISLCKETENVNNNLFQSLKVKRVKSNKQRPNKKIK